MQQGFEPGTLNHYTIMWLDCRACYNFCAILVLDLTPNHNSYIKGLSHLAVHQFEFPLVSLCGVLPPKNSVHKLVKSCTQIC